MESECTMRGSCPSVPAGVAIQECGRSVGLLADGCVGLLADGSVFSREDKTLDFSFPLPQVCRDIKAILYK